MTTPKRPPGRPPVAENARRSARVELRLTQAERSKLERLGGAEWLRIELDSDSITVRAADNITLFAGYGLPDDTHGEYAEWAKWDGCRFATPDDSKAFQAAIESLVERHDAGSADPAA